MPWGSRIWRPRQAHRGVTDLAVVGWSRPGLRRSTSSAVDAVPSAPARVLTLCGGQAGLLTMRARTEAGEGQAGVHAPVLAAQTACTWGLRGLAGRLAGGVCLMVSGHMALLQDALAGLHAFWGHMCCGAARVDRVCMDTCPVAFA